MTIWCLGSINADHVYRVPHIPAPGETLRATSLDTGLGGKGTNMAVAAARAGAHVRMIGAVGSDGRWAVERLMEYGVDTRSITEVEGPTGHAIIAVSDDGENSILLMPGANAEIPLDTIRNALSEAQTGDIFLAQNETNAQTEAATLAAEMGLTVAYAAAPFDADAVDAMLPMTDFLILNEVEMEQLSEATGLKLDDLQVGTVIVTKGGDGATLAGTDHETVTIPAEKADVVDTTGAGDTFTGYVLAGLDRGMPMQQAMGLAAKAAAIKVERSGAADAIPDLKDVQDRFG